MSRHLPKRRIKHEVAFPIAAAVAAPAGGVLADEPAAESSVEEIVVTAQRREESLQKTSVAMQVVSPAQSQYWNEIVSGGLTTHALQRAELSAAAMT